MKILQICFRPQIPANDGGAIAMYNLTKGFVAHKEVSLSLFVFNTPKHNVSLEELNNEFSIPDIYQVFINTKINLGRVFLNIFSKKSYNIERFNTVEAKNELKAVLQNDRFDVVHFEGLYTSTMLETVRLFAPKAKVVLRSHNMEYLIWERRASQAKNKLQKWYLKSLAKKLKNYEDNIIDQFDAIVPITEVDKLYFLEHGAKDVFTSSTGVEVENYLVQMPIDENAVFHLGSLDWHPNQEALIWFLEQIWPKVVNEVPNAKFYLAGKNMPSWFYKYKSSTVKILGEVENASDFMSSHGIMVVPLLSGSGMRIKIIEGMACACPIVSTKIGAEGIICEDGKDIYLAETPNVFANKLVELLQNTDLATQMGSNARHNIENNYSNKAKSKELIEFYKKIIN